MRIFSPLLALKYALSTGTACKNASRELAHQGVKHEGFRDEKIPVWGSKEPHAPGPKKPQSGSYHFKMVGIPLAQGSPARSPEESRARPQGQNWVLKGRRRSKLSGKL